MTLAATFLEAPPSVPAMPEGRGVSLAWLRAALAGGELAQAVSGLARADPARLQAILGTEAPALVRLLAEGSPAERRRWLASVTAGGAVAEPWRTRLAQLVQEPAFAAQRRFLVGAPGGAWSLQEDVARYLRGVDAAEHARLNAPGTRALCVEVSLGVLVAVCQRLGVRLRPFATRDRTYLVPAIRAATADGLDEVPLGPFFALWWSAMGSPGWARSPETLRGAGAPGALRYAGLAQPLVLSSAADLAAVAWPAGLAPGAFLQLWKDEAAYRGVRSGPPGKYPGHSIAFQRYDSRKVLVALDQFGRERTFECGRSYRFLVGANLRDVDVPTPG